jgi:hypothetical protein
MRGPLSVSDIAALGDSEACAVCGAPAAERTAILKLPVCFHCLEAKVKDTEVV